MKGNRSASGFQPEGSVERHGKLDLLSCLVAAVDTHEQPRKYLAETFCQMEEPQFSKVLGGSQGVKALEILGTLPREVRMNFYRRALALDGAEVHDPTPAELTDALLDQLQQLFLTFRTVKRRMPLKADLATAADRSGRRSA